MPFTLEPSTLCSIDMGSLALKLSLKSDKTIKIRLEVNSLDSNSDDNPHVATVPAATYTDVTQKLIYKELAVMNLLTIRT